MKLNAEYCAEASRAQELVGAIETDRTSKWSWAQNAGNLGELKEALNSLQSIITPEFRHVLLGSTATLKKDIGKDLLPNAMQEFVSTLKPRVESLQRVCDNLLQRHKVGYILPLEKQKKKKRNRHRNTEMKVR